jgi:DNA polymerase-3 subunit delta'
LIHPDFHWFIPITRPKATEADKQIEEAAELLAEAVAARSAEPWHQRPDGMAVHPLASARLLLRRAALTPVAGARKVFLLGEADRLVPQESSPESANALLKLLEEPPANTWILLTTTDAERVLPTIRSRAVGLRLSRLGTPEVRGFVAEHLRPVPPPAELDQLVARAEGAIGALAASGDQASRSAVEARAYLAAVQRGTTEAYERALKQTPWAARGGFTDLLDAVAAELSARARTGARDAASPESLAGVLRAQELVRVARAEAQGNVNPQVLLASLSLELAAVL